MNENNTTSITFFPEDRLNPHFSIQIWAIGWLGILKSCIWIFTDPIGPDGILKTMGIRYLIMTIPFFCVSIGIFNKKKWAVWGMILVCVLEILFFLIYPKTMNTLVLDNLTTISLIFSMVIFVINGPISDVLILIVIPFIFKFLKD
ncbi:MAG: hypothetical protein KJ737_01665 [Proteobacteria bacterium]|nr:hypothetical protein [Pseudomonadota bacterium]